ncbi:MAG TPA: fatty acid desaturase [Pyrinomonadaceae bacterium]|nr:fatty acid desaturase [Pyrinomonadaceae bacterium]
MTEPVRPATRSLELQSAQKVVELARPWILFALYLLSAAAGWWLLAIPLAVVTCLAGFIQMHDSIHRSLGLSQKGHDFVLSASGLLLLKCGHGLQITHLRHHGRCLKDDDPEGVCATWPFYRVLLEGPLHIFTMRFYSFKRASHTMRFQVIETAATVGLVVVAVLLYVLLKSPVGLVYWAVAACLSATIPVWAAYLPHRLAPQHPAVRSAGRIAQIWTPVISSFAFHHLHHAFPRVPTALLPVLAVRDEAQEYKAHVHSHEIAD